MSNNTSSIQSRMDQDERFRLFSLPGLEDDLSREWELMGIAPYVPREADGPAEGTSGHDAERDGFEMT